MKLKISEDVELMDKYLNYSSYIEDVDTTGENIIYKLKLPNNVISQISINKHDNGDIEYNIVEDDLENNIIITEDNKIYVDGKEVTISESNNTQTDGIKSETISRRANRTIWTTENCPYGRASDYSVYDGNISNSNVWLTNRIVDLTYGGFGLVLGKYAPLEGITLFLTSEIKDGVEELDPKTQCLSYDSDLYVHKTKGAIVSGNLTVRKAKTVWYAKTNFKGSSFRTTSFNCKEYY